MKLATLDSFIVKNPPPGFGGRYFIFVTLTTSCGVTGTGEIYAASFAPEVITAMADDIFQRYLEGQSPFQIEKHNSQNILSQFMLVFCFFFAQSLRTAK